MVCMCVCTDAGETDEGNATSSSTAGNSQLEKSAEKILRL